jgi:hypothetical protein
MNLFVSAHQLYGATVRYTRVIQVEANRNIQKYPGTVLFSFIMLTKDKKPGLILKYFRKIQEASTTSQCFQVASQWDSSPFKGF